MAAPVIDRPTFDQSKFESFLFRAIGDLSAGYGGVMVSLGNKLGLYKAMASAGPLTSRSACNGGVVERGDSLTPRRTPPRSVPGS